MDGTEHMTPVTVVVITGGTAGAGRRRSSSAWVAAPYYLGAGTD